MGGLLSPLPPAEKKHRTFPAFIVTNMSRPAERVVAYKRGTCEQWIKEGKGAIKWTRLSRRTFAANAVAEGPASNRNWRSLITRPNAAHELHLLDIPNTLCK